MAQIMRLFIAVDFPKETKAELGRLSVQLKEHMAKGRITEEKNFHLTLVFLGETSRVGEVKEVMNRVKGKPFRLEFVSVGRFKRRGSDIPYVKVKQEDGLWNVQEQLSQGLKQKGFPLEDRGYSPHITLAREAVWKENGFTEEIGELVPEISPVEVRRLSLMKSERISGKLVYSEIYEKEL